MWKTSYLVGLEHEFYFSIYFVRGVGLNHQPLIFWSFSEGLETPWLFHPATKSNSHEMGESQSNSNEKENHTFHNTS